MLLTLGLLTNASQNTALDGVGAPIARSYDGHPWEVATTGPTEFARALSQSITLLRTGPSNNPNQTSSVDLPTPALGRAYRIDRYTTSGDTNVTTSRLASRFLMQATFGPTTSLLSALLDEPRNSTSLARNGGSAANSYAARLATFHDAARDWVGAQMAAPMSLLRTHYRRRVNPRLSPAQRNPFIEDQPVCRPGSTWQTFTFNAWDRGAAVTFEGLPPTGAGAHGYRVSIDGEVRTEIRFSGVDANYTQVTNGRCTGMLELITSIDECTAAAIALNVNWDNNGGSSASSPQAMDDRRNGSSAGPRGCYLEGNPPIWYPSPTGLSAHSRDLEVNIANTNTGDCKPNDVCICRRVRLNQPTPASGMAPPPPPPRPPCTGSMSQCAAGNLTSPSQCSSSQCCAVLFKGAPGANCGPVPIFDFTNWVHPGGASLVTPARLCGSVRFSWLSRSSSHLSVCDVNQNCDPEANRWSPPLAGGAVRVGTYFDTTSAACATSASTNTMSRRTFTLCSIEEGINGPLDYVAVGTPCCNPPEGTSSCSTSSESLFTQPNPTIVLPNDRVATDPLRAQSVAAAHITMARIRSSSSAPDLYVLEHLDAPCALSSQRSPTHIQVLGSGASSSTWYRLDHRLRFQTNTVESPCAGIASDNESAPYDGVAGACPSVGRIPWLNAATCMRQPSCTPPNFGSKLFQLNQSSLRAYYERAGVLAYAVSGLRLDGTLAGTPFASQSPCEPGISRWKRLGYTSCDQVPPTSGGGTNTALDPATRRAIEQTLLASSDANEYFKDINVVAYITGRVGSSCTSSYNGALTMGARLSISGSCWRQVPRQEGNVYDFSYWASSHPGTVSYDENSNPIEAFAKAGGTAIQFPTSHSMSTRWWSTVLYQSGGKQGGRYLPYVGRLGDVVDFATLPAPAQPREMAAYLGTARDAAPTQAASEQVCGSPGEVSSEPRLGHRYKTWMGDNYPGRDALVVPHDPQNGKMMVWTTVVLGANDQLRQRAAFALSQILVIGEQGLDNFQFSHVEEWAVYYDIFVRHAFGSYRAILNEVSHSPLMSKYLTYDANRGLHIAGTNADENYAREIMQLFTIGLWRLKSDGTHESTAAGASIPTYDNGDIMAFARVWTGYVRQASRANQENEGAFVPQAGRPLGMNYIDPVYLDAYVRDYFPKMDLHDRYLGDRYPLCVDLPARAFLRVGARYRYLSRASARPPVGDTYPYAKDAGLEQYSYDKLGGKDPYRDDWNEIEKNKVRRGWVNRTAWLGSVPDPAEPRFVLANSSALYAQLCGGSVSLSGACTFPLEVTLSANLACTGLECDVDTARTVQLTSPDGVTVEYEYVRVPCVELTWFTGGRVVRDVPGNQMCVHPQTAAAGPACCRNDGSDGNGYHQCRYFVERVTYATAEQRCNMTTAAPPSASPTPAARWAVCDAHVNRGAEGCGYAGSDDPRSQAYLWSRRACQTFVQVHPEGWVGVVHTFSAGGTFDQFRPHAAETFPVRWTGGLFPRPSNGLSCEGTAGRCAVNTNPATQLPTCMCSANVVEVAVFNRSDVLPTAAEVVERLAVGSVPPSTFDTGTYTRCTSAACLTAAPDVVVYLHAAASPPGSLDQRAIFQVRVNGTTMYLLNKESILSLGNFSFRNPPRFVSWVEPAARDAEYETSALLDHLVYHPNTAPFIVYRLIQRLVTSNPSPRYVSAVVDAFRTGQLNSSGLTFSGQYGDLGATFAAILLDREARSLTLERDPSFGQLREPLLKLLHLMRAMEFVSKDGREVELAGVFHAIGQQVFQSPSVFNFYKPEFQASGAIIAAELASPEAELSTAPSLVGFLNGVSSLVRLGLTSCEDGFGSLYSNAKTAVGGGFPPIASSRSCEKPAERFFSPPQVGGVDGSSNDGELEFRPTNASDAAATVAELDLLLTAGRLSPNTRALLESEYERMRLGPLGRAEYVIATSQNCSAWMAANIDSIAECEDAARYLRNYSAQAFGLFTATDDGSSAQRTRARGCYHRKTSTAEELKVNLLRNNYGVCTTNYHCLCKVAGERPALKRVQELLVISPEFHSVNEPQPYNVPRAPPSTTASQGRPYKAVVVLFLNGGLDSWNLLVPHSGCVAGNSSTNYEQYEATRGIVALGRDELLRVSARPGTQPHTVCTTFGMHPALPIVHSLYGASQAAFFANTGTLVRPITKAQFLANTVEMPPQLFAHNIQVRCTQSVHAQQIAAKGVLGRIVDTLGAAGGAAFRTASYSLDGLKKMLDGEKTHNILDGTGAKRFGRYGALRAQITNLTSVRQRSLFTETYAQFVESSLGSSELLGSMLETVPLLSTRWSPRDAVNNVCFESETCKKFEQVARVIASRNLLQEERQVFYVELGGFDTHTSAKEVVQLKLNDINAALTAFVDEMRLRGVWNGTAVVTASDFARTLDSNGAGTDHAWGGNYVLLGGGVSGGTIHGQYPTSFLSSNEVTVLRNRLMPTTSWEAVWHGIAQWLDVPAAQMGYVLPNAANFPSTQLFRKEDLFTTVPTGGGGGGGATG